MSVNLWRFFLEDDVDGFRHFLANATYFAGPQKAASAGGALGNAASKIGSSSPGTLATSPKTPSKSRKSSGQTQTISAGQPARNASTVLTRGDVNAKDGHGRTLLHHIASSQEPTAIGFASALLEIPFLDLYAQDAENGWTALHRALYFGRVSITQALMLRDIKDATDYTTTVSHTHAGGLIKIKDHEGNSPFEIFGLTIASRLLETNEARLSMGAGDDGSNVSVDLNNDDSNEDPKQKWLVKPLTNLEGDEAFAFGSNKNLTLGLGDEDDRQYPERLSFVRPEHLLHRLREEHELSRQKALAVEDLAASQYDSLQHRDIPALIRNQPLTIQEMVMSKLHTAVLTNDPVSNLYVCGFGPGGRLGTGDEATRYNYVCIQTGGLANRKVAAVALGQDHTIAICSHGEVFTWGGNRYGQLGYNLPEASANEMPKQLLPRQLYGHIKKELIIGAAASSTHSAIYTSTALYTFGKNEGQLGIMDADAGSLEIQVIPRRVGVSILQSPILTVCAIDRATIVLLENHDVFVFTHYGFKKIDDWPLEQFRNYSLNHLRDNKICKITAGGNTVSGLSTFGEVFTVDVGKCDPPPTSTTNPNKARNALPVPTRVWTIRKGHMCATDVAVGQDGSIILCTESGSVWRKEKRAKIKSVGFRDTGSARPKDYKFARVPNLTRAIAVRSNAFGAFVAIRRDCSVTREQIVVDPPGLWDDIFPLLPFHTYKIDETADSEETRPRFWTGTVKEFSPAQIKHAILHSEDAEADLKTMLAKFEPLSDSPYDLRITSNVTDVRIPMQSFLMKGRSTVLRRALAEFQESYYYSIPDFLSIEYGSDGQIQMQFQGADFLTITNLALYIYTENIIDVWHYTSRAVQMAPRYRQVRTELMKIATQLDLRHLERAVRVMTEPVKTLHLDLECAIRDQDFFSDHDLLLELANGVEVPAHSGLLCARCPFFDGLFRGRAGGRWMVSRKTEADESEETLRIDLKHIDVKIFQMVLRHIYADTGDELFDDVVTGDVDGFIDLVIEVMSVANELMLDRLAQICQMTLGKFVTTRNICSLLNTVAECSVEEFKRAGLEYVCLNLESMLDHRLLEELDPDLLMELDEMVQSNQLAFMPFARSGRAQAKLLERHPELVGQIGDAQKRRVDSMRLRTRFNEEDDERPSGGSKVRVGSFERGSMSPLGEHDRRSSSRDLVSPAASPAIRPIDSEHDLPFAMDDDRPSSGRSPGLGVGLSSPSIKPRDLSQGSPSLEPSGWLDARGKPIASSIGTDASSLSISHLQKGPTSPSLSRTPVSQSAIKIEGFGSSSPAWKTSARPSFKIDLHDIMTQASASRTSNLTQAMKAESTDTFKTVNRMSQKERKKLQQQQLNATGTLPTSPGPDSVPAQATSAKASSPWQNVNAAPKSSLKDVMSSTAQPSEAVTEPARPRVRPIARTNMTMRQTVAGTPPNLKDQQAKQSRSVSTPNLTPSAKAAPHPIQSVRHIQFPAASSSSLDARSSMAEILAQQELDKNAVKEAVAKRSLQEIQQEQEFQQWWEHESRRVQQQEEEEAASSSRKSRAGGGRGGGGGRRGSGRGDAGRTGARGGKRGSST